MKMLLLVLAVASCIDSPQSPTPPLSPPELPPVTPVPGCEIDHGALNSTCYATELIGYAVCLKNIQCGLRVAALHDCVAQVSDSLCATRDCSAAITDWQPVDEWVNTYNATPCPL